MGWEQDRWRETAPRHVVMVSRHACVRVEKQAAALRARGWRVDSLSLRRPRNMAAFDYAMTATVESMSLNLHANGARIIHVHNEPDRLMRFADAGCRERAIVYDCHDIEANRFDGIPTDDERFAFARADGIISVSAPHRDVAYALHPWKCPEAVVYSLPLRAWRQTGDGPRSGVVYQGGLREPGVCPWRDLSVPVREFTAAGIDFDIFAAKAMEEHYPRVQGFAAYHDLLKRLTGYSYGFCGHDPAHTVYQTAMPNKVWEYAMCGVIPLFVSLPHAAEVFGSGIVAKDTREAIAMIRDIEAYGGPDVLRADVLAHARYMDDEIDNTIRLYEELL